MRKFTKEEIERLESGGIYASEIFEGMAGNMEGNETLLLENAPDEIKSAFGKTTEKIEETENGKAIKEAFGTKRELEDATPNKEGLKGVFNGKKKEEKTFSQDTEDVREAFGGHSPDLEEAIANSELLQETVSIDEISEDNGTFKFRGKALKVDRRNKNNRRYKREITEKALAEARKSGRVLTIRDGHPQKNDTRVSPVIGKVVFGDLQEDGWLPYEGQISNTSRGMDVQKLLRDKCIGDVSLRSKGHTAMAKMDGEAIDEVVSLEFRGLDLVTAGSEEGAKVDEIFNSYGSN